MLFFLVVPVQQLSLLANLFQKWFGEGIVNFIRRCFRVLQEEVSDYYVAIFSRKAGVPICLVLCVLTIVSYALLHS